jgi:hypothetical protein
MPQVYTTNGHFLGTMTIMGASSCSTATSTSTSPSTAGRSLSSQGSTTGKAGWTHSRKCGAPSRQGRAILSPQLLNSQELASRGPTCGNIRAYQRCLRCL